MDEDEYYVTPPPPSPHYRSFHATIIRDRLSHFVGSKGGAQQFGVGSAVVLGCFGWSVGQLANIHPLTHTKRICLSIISVSITYSSCLLMIVKMIMNSVEHAGNISSRHTFR